MNALHQSRTTRLAYRRKVLKLEITPVMVDVGLIKERSPKTITHHNYPLDLPILISKRPSSSEFYSIRDGRHRYQQALELGNTHILAIIGPERIE